MAVRGFVARQGAYVAEVDEAERAVLVDAVDQVVELLGGAGAADAPPFRLGAAPVEPPDDPAVRRLLPDASRADPEVAAEFRRLTEADLRATKVTNLLALRAALAAAAPHLTLAPDVAPAIAAGLTDVRLVLADRLGIRTDDDAAALDGALAAALSEGGPDDDPDEAPDPATAALLFAASLYGVLGLLQDSLIELMLDALPDDDEPEPTRPPR